MSKKFQRAEYAHKYTTQAQAELTAAIIKVMFPDVQTRVERDENPGFGHYLWTLTFNNYDDDLNSMEKVAEKVNDLAAVLHPFLVNHGLVVRSMKNE